MIQFQDAVFTRLLIEVADFLERRPHRFMFLRSGQHRHTASLRIDRIVCSGGQCQKDLQDLVGIPSSCRVDLHVPVGGPVVNQQWLGKSSQSVMVALASPGNDAVADDRQLHFRDELGDDRQQGFCFVRCELIGDKFARLARRFRTVPLFHKRLQRFMFLLGRPDEQPLMRIVRNNLECRIHFGEQFPGLTRHPDGNRVSHHYGTVCRGLSIGERFQ